MLELPEKIKKQIGHHLVFFANEGLSMSEANSVAGKAGDIADMVGRLLGQTGSFVKTTDLDGKIVRLVAPKKIENLVEVAQKDGDLYGLKAYLMEAIKAKNAVIEYLKNTEAEEFLQDGEKMNDYDKKDDEYPARETVSENTILQTWSLDERAEYYLLESQVAHIGKKIHPNGIIDRLAQESFEGTRFEREELNSGLGATKTHIAEVTSLYSPEEAQNAFYQLHDARREREKRLNFLKARLQNELNARQIEAERDYSMKLSEYTELQKAKRAADQQLVSALEARRLQLVRRASDLKIVVPDALAGIYDSVVNFSGRLV